MRREPSAPPSRAGDRRPGLSGAALSGAPGCAAADDASSFVSFNLQCRCGGPIMALTGNSGGPGPWSRRRPARGDPHFTAKWHGMVRPSKTRGLGRCWDPDEYFLRIMVIASSVEKRKENRNYRTVSPYINREPFWPCVPRGNEARWGSRWGAGVCGLFSRVSRRIGRVARQTEGELA